MTSSPPAPYRVALIGYGLAGSAFHAPLIATTPGLRLDAVVTANPDRRAQLAKEHPGARALDTPEQLFAEAGEFDVVVIASPNRTHLPLARAALRAGLATVVDKPLATSAEEALALCGLAHSRGTLLTVFQNRRWDNDFRTVRRLIEQGALGRVHRFESRFERFRPKPKAGWRELADPAEAGGTLYDLGSHLVDQALTLFGPVSTVYAEIDTRRDGAVVDDDAFLALTHASGVRSHLWTSAIAPLPGPRLRVLGDRAGYLKFGLDPQEADLRAGRRPGDGVPWGVEEAALHGTLGTDQESATVATDPGDYPAFYAALAHALATGTPPPVDPYDAVATLTVLEAARRSSATGTTVALP
ncbi:Gfo/Idh/MocA family oxidoreductase [Kitasatospora sp. NBC_01287]|uniref:Gfo/Idh/MocA family oxidoreductase n=1 Tax=Kitasatospora sp. NBC_01287 TaxID=2903573 RepID=UPI0022521F11|nr:Gfo/Idh/MocA family oxidoreductase [Kitasatospora sp. NBC_01287]MCX4748810.1 Gfo/Idh/MocA family oxidoreductase [Kitasatospora sp. NBC_01287]